MRSATERFKALLANALERVCILEAELEAARERIAGLEQADAMTNGHGDALVSAADETEG